MPPHSLGSGTISFGLVSIPVRLYTAASSANVSFNLLHAKCGSRIKQQTFCPTCNEVVDRASLVKGYEFAKDQYVRVTDDELKGLEGEASKVIDIAEFVPLQSVDPIFFEKTYYHPAGARRPHAPHDVLRGRGAGLRRDRPRPVGEDQAGRARPGAAAHRRSRRRRVPAGAIPGRVPPPRPRPHQPEGRGQGSHGGRSPSSARPGDRPDGGPQGEPGQAGRLRGEEAPGEGQADRARPGGAGEEGPGRKEVALRRPRVRMDLGRQCPELPSSRDSRSNTCRSSTAKATSTLPSSPSCPPTS
ncbi:MAG: hypothetical protein DME03_04740 [Candidatus Rokuibacteriota bacterium]|nr:MAG: hypothetical protein DME03_04740 [Candidatus Rokubacteria bacterium]